MLPRTYDTMKQEPNRGWSMIQIKWTIESYGTRNLEKSNEISFRNT